MDQMVKEVQKWANATYSTYSSYTEVNEDGITGNATIKALIIGLQIELGISTPNGVFGPATFSACPIITTNSSFNLTKIVQGALFCKGYNPTGFTGTYGAGTSAAIIQFKTDAGLANPNGDTTAIVMKALLTMDAFVNVGYSKIREIQQSLNRDYSNVYGSQIGLIACDGLTSRNLSKAMIYALQIEGNIAADGIWGPSTLASIPTISMGSTRTKYVLLLQYALYLNEFDPGEFDGVFDAALKAVVKDFQMFCMLGSDGIAGKQTFASLFISYGDKNRSGTACDCVTTITPARAQALKAAGYKTIGRYIVGDWKKIKPGELSTIFAAGLTVFPIYQTSGNNANYFNAAQGAKDAIEAIKAANSYGFGAGTTIYFAVDYDAYDKDIYDNIRPHFQAIFNKVNALGGKYEVGIYGPRNVCFLVSSAGYANTSFVSDMSSGFSGNIGHSLPYNWAFDQITTISVGSGDGLIEIDKNIKSGRDNGQSTVYSSTTLPLDDTFLSTQSRPLLRSELIAEVFNQITDPQQIKSIRSEADAVDIVLSYDALITELSQTYNIRKALIQCVLLRELYCENIQDFGTDLAVRDTYAWKHAMVIWENSGHIGPAPTPPPVLWDASTGHGQIYAWVAIDSINYAITADIITGDPYPTDDWQVTWAMWQKLNDDNVFNISTIPLVLLYGAHLKGLEQGTYAYNVAETKQIIARYNGTSDAATFYGEIVYNLYAIFEKYNKIDRGEP